MAVRRQERRGNRAAWVAANPVLAAGEIGVENADALSLTARVKVGDGVTAWNALGYVGGGDTGWRKVTTGGVAVDWFIKREHDTTTVAFVVDSFGFSTTNADLIASLTAVLFTADGWGRERTGFSAGDIFGKVRVPCAGDNSGTEDCNILVDWFYETVVINGSDGGNEAAEFSFHNASAWPTSLVGVVAP